MAEVLGGEPLTRLAIAVVAVLGLAACDLPGAHAADAAVVNGHAVPRSRWDHLVDLTSNQLKSRVSIDLGSEAGRVQVRSIQTKALQAVVREELIEQMAAQRKVKVTEADVDAEVARVSETLGGAAAVTKRLDQDGESMGDLRHILRINLLKSRMKAASPTYDADFDTALKNARVDAYVAPCDSDHSWPQCAGGQR
ncbi:MAG: hypothetical protein NVSMB17_04850 [Candidatus Dormibacteria bacterium]